MTASPCDGELGHVGGDRRIELGGEPRSEVASLRREAEHDGAIAALTSRARRASPRSTRARTSRAGVLDDVHDVGAVRAELLGVLRPRRARPRGAACTSPPPDASAARRAAVTASSATLRSAVPRVSAKTRNVRHQSTFASVWRSRTSSGTAATPSPMMRPAGRSGGSSIAAR